MRRRIRFAGVLVLMLVVTVALAGCGLLAGTASAKYSAQDLTALFDKHAEAANWELKVRDVIGQKKSNGSHMSAYTVFLTTWTNKQVPEFKMYGTVDVPNDDTMTFEERANAFFDAVAAGSEFSGVQDKEAFMTFWAKEYPDKFFVRLIQNTDETGKSTWEVVAFDSAPTDSTFTDVKPSGIVLTYDDATKTWAQK